MTIQEIRTISGLNKTDFCKKYDIPYRTLQNWERGERECPKYVKTLLARIVEYDKAEKKA